MSGLSFFAKRRFFNKADLHLMRGSSMIRGEQIAAHLGAKINPLSGFEDDICIYVKPNNKAVNAGDIKFAKYAYIDVVDGYDLIKILIKRPQYPVIVCSKYDYNLLSQKIRNRLFYIPQQSCNFERAVRIRKGVTTIGMIGNAEGNKYIPDGFEFQMKKLGLNFIVYSTFYRRSDIVKFYKQIDVQFVWRPWRKELSNPLKIVNAASFGIPTVALQEETFNEVEGCYFPVKTADEAVMQIKQLMNFPDLYDECVKRCLAKAEEYHIDNVAELYKKLEKYE